MFFSRLTRLQTCCGFISLRLGCLLLGYVEIYGNCYGIYKASTGEDDWEDLILYLLGAIYLILINLFLVWGIHKEKKKALLPWIVSKFIGYIGFTIFYGIKFVETGFLLPYVDERNLQILIIGFCTLLAFILLLTWYSFFCVYSFYKIEIKAAEPEVKTEETIEEKNEENEKEEKKDK